MSGPFTLIPGGKPKRMGTLHVSPQGKPLLLCFSWPTEHPTNLIQEFSRDSVKNTLMLNPCADGEGIAALPASACSAPVPLQPESNIWPGCGGTP